MFNVGDVVIYGTTGICKLEGITENEFGGEKIEYYVLSPLSRKDDTVFVPKNNEKILSRMRHVLTKEKARELLDNLPEEPMEWITNDRERQRAYKDILLYGSSADVLMMTRSLYLHQLEQYEKGKKLHASDERFLKDAEKMVFDELAYVFGISTQEVLPMITHLKSPH